MPSFRDFLLICYAQDLLDVEEFILLYHLNSPRRVHDGTFDLEELTEDQCKAEFRFTKHDIYVLKDVLNISEEITCNNRLVVDGTEALCILLKRLAYPVTYNNMADRFGRSATHLKKIVCYITNMLYTYHRERLTSLQQHWLSPANLQSYANAIHSAGSVLDNCWGFVDSTVTQPSDHPNKKIYKGSKQVSAIKFQSVVAPNGLIANLYGPIEATRHDCSMLRESGMLPQLDLYSRSPTGNPLCIYGDMKYPIRPQLQMPFTGVHLSPSEQAYNASIAGVKGAVQWVFDDIGNYFNFLDFRKSGKISFDAIKKVYAVCGILRNAHTCLYESTSTVDVFNVHPPSIHDYFS